VPHNNRLDRKRNGGDTASCSHLAPRDGFGREIISRSEMTTLVGEPLPTLPLWLSETLTVTVDLEASYQETCRVLRIP
jgi:hypothetical protein